jgi:nucleotide-binding universal stress UspA family protein
LLRVEFMATQVIGNRQPYPQSSHGVFANVERKPFRVLIPYDGSENAELALRSLKLAGMPKQLDAVVAISHVWLPSSPYEITRAVSARRTKLLTSGLSSFAPAMRDDEEQRVLASEANARIRSIFPAASVTTDVMEGSASAVNEIVGKAKRCGAELIVLGSNKSPSPQITDYAGPALSVARAAHCSVLIARRSERKNGSGMRIVIGMDETKSVAEVFELVSGRDWPAASGVDIVLTGYSGPRDPLRESQTAAALQGLANKLRAIGLDASTTVEYGEPQDLLLRYVKEKSADYIFIRSNILDRDQVNGNGGLSKIAQSVLLGAHCSVEIVRPRAVTHQHLLPAA